jgi:hypothetical protein
MKVLYADRARSVEAAVAVDTNLRAAEEALAKGRTAEAKSKLDEVQSTLPTVSTEDGQADLRARTDELLALLPDNPVDGVLPPPEAAPSTAAGSPAVGPVSSEPPASAPTVQATTPPPPTTTLSPQPVTTTTQPVIETTDAEPNTGPKAEPNEKASKGHVPTARTSG